MTQSPLLEHFRDFNTIQNDGISFNCTDRDVCMNLGVGTVTIWGRKFRIQPYSKYSHWYYVDIQRLPDDATDGIIYDWFVDHGTRSVYITSSPSLAGSDHASAGGSPPYYVYNHYIPPFIKEIKERHNAAKEIKDKKIAAKEIKVKQDSTKKVSPKPDTPTPAPPKGGKKA
ncbi:hypothetical protein PsorP6_010166 [Peronosclerospora sorghi]|uniref:Uncharacterized protein n=1 Tax=Peronosclerospora sorghi TaxID=230839 RepID=A0ACC0VWC5_9STRA|nr:hypothetical protein PsorP6_010166 [Peronosclerospora sorghi]